VERRAGPGEEWLTATKHYGAEVESILINKAKLGQTPRQLRSGDFDLPALKDMRSDRGLKARLDGIM